MYKQKQLLGGEAVSMSSIYLALIFQMGERQKNSAEVQVPNKMLFDPAENCQFLALLNNTSFFGTIVLRR